MNETIAALLILTAAAGSAETISLQQAVDLAIFHSAELRALDARVAEARADAGLSDPFRPSASLVATPGYATGLPTAILGQVPAIGTVETHRLFYDLDSRIEQMGADDRIVAAEAALESRKAEIVRATADLYANAGADALLVASAERRMKAYETILGRTTALGREQRARALDVDRAKLELAKEDRRLREAQTRLELDRLKLRSLVGEPVDVQLTVAPATPPPAGTLATAEAGDPVLKSLDARIESLDLARTLQSRLLQPSVAAQLQYSRLFDSFGRYYNHFKPDDFSVGATMTLPVWTGGHRAAEAAKLLAQLDGLKAERDARRSEIEIETREAEADLVDAIAESQLASEADDLAEADLRTARQLLSEGRGEPNDAELAEIAVAEADDAVTIAAVHRTTARARLLVLRGELAYR